MKRKMLCVISALMLTSVLSMSAFAEELEPAVGGLHNETIEAVAEADTAEELVGITIPKDAAAVDGSAVKGEITAEKLEDWYKFTTGSDCVYYTFTLNQVSERNINFPNRTYLHIYSDEYQQMLEITSSDSDRIHSKNVKLKPNTTYYIKMSCLWDNYTEYSFSYTTTADIADSKETAVDAVPDTLYKDTFCVNGDQDWFKYTTGSQAENCTFRAYSVSGDMKFSICDAESKYLCQENVRENETYEETFTLKANSVYYICYKSYDSYYYECEYTLKITSKKLKAFADVTDTNEFYYEPVIWAVSKGITTGTSDTTFSPNANCIRGQVVTFLWRAYGSPKPTISNPFTDIKPTDYWYDAVVWAYEKGITTGTSKTTFSPNAKVTRRDFVTFLWRANGSPSAVFYSNPFDDVPTKQYYTDAIKWAYKNGITTGTSANTFGPTQVCKRSQVVTFIYRAMK